MNVKLFSILPGWLEALVIGAVKKAVTPAELATAWTALVTSVVDQVQAWAASTSTKVDDYLADKLEDAFLKCSPDVTVLCELIAKGEAALVAFLRAAAARTDTKLDDLAVDMIAMALGVPVAAKA